MKVSKKDKQIMGMFYIADCALRACVKALNDKSRHCVLDNDYSRFKQRITAMSNELGNKMDNFNDEVLSVIEDTDGNFFRAVAGVLQIAEKCFENKKNTNKLYKMFYLQDYMDYVCERENGDERI